MRLMIHTSCWQWWRRLHTCLSAIYAQPGHKIDISIRVNTCFKKDGYRHLGDACLRSWYGVLPVQHVDWEDDAAFAFRRNIRNRDLAETPEDVDWILWLDPDIVLHPLFFATLQDRLPKIRHEGKVIAVQRVCLFPQDGLLPVSVEDFRHPIPMLWERLGAGATTGRSSNVGAGYFQLVDRKSLAARGITHYCASSRDAPVFRRTHKYHTDAERRFRRACGGVARGRGLAPVGHIEHPRGDDKVNFDPIACY